MICVRAGAERSLRSVVWGNSRSNIYRTFSLPPRCSLSAEDCSGLRAFSLQSSAERLRRGNNIFNLIFMDVYLITIFSTILAVFAFIARQIILKSFIKPIYKQKEVIEEIADVLCRYRRFFVNFKKKDELKDSENNKKRKEAEEKLEKLGSQLISNKNSIPCYEILAVLGAVVKKQNIHKAEKELNVLVNTVNSISTEGISKTTGLKAVGKLFELLDLGIYTKD